VSISVVAQYYKDFLDVLVVDERDAEAAEELRASGLRVSAAKTLMRTNEERADLAHATLLAVNGQNAAHAGPNPS
jgi:2-phospho-L-lactate transferase/gluconeogenesis factor (CofD/UPF0052 family)